MTEPLWSAEESWIGELPPNVRRPVLAFADPHPPGARARAALAAEAIAELAESWPARRPGLRQAIDGLIGNLHRVGQSTVHQPGIGNAIAYVLAEGVPDDPVAAGRLLRGRATALAETMRDASATMAGLGADLLDDGDTVLVHDFADRSTQAVVTQAARDGKRLTVIATACRSRRTDGIRVAREATAVGHRAIVVTDAGIGWVVARGGLRACFIGADAVMPDGTAMTTPGALTIGLVGRRFGTPVYCVTDLWKVMPAIPPELHALNEVPDPDGVPEALEWQAEGFGFYNPLVDFVPGDLLTGLVTEAGIIEPAATGATAERRYGVAVDAATTVGR
jgi:translation initiation factor 2B subunit (eIF-2B alpha/beta/delta family)